MLFRSPNNFENHKVQSLDKVYGRDLTQWSFGKVLKMYEPYIKFLYDNKESYPKELVNKYFIKD